MTCHCENLCREQHHKLAVRHMKYMKYKLHILHKSNDVCNNEIFCMHVTIVYIYDCGLHQSVESDVMLLTHKHPCF